MADISNVDTQKLLSAADELEAIVGRMAMCSGNFFDALEELNKGWISEVKTAFLANEDVDYDAIHEMLAQLGEINSWLRNAANDFDKTESEITSEVNALG